MRKRGESDAAVCCACADQTQAAAIGPRTRRTCVRGSKHTRARNAGERRQNRSACVAVTCAQTVRTKRKCEQLEANAHHRERTPPPRACHGRRSPRATQRLAAAPAVPRAPARRRPPTEQREQQHGGKGVHGGGITTLETGFALRRFATRGALTLHATAVVARAFGGAIATESACLFRFRDVAL